MIEVGEWLHVKPSELSCERIDPTQLNKYKNRVQEPFFRLMIGNREVMVNGRKMFWALLDALFPDDPLPRTPVNQQLQADPHEFLFDLNSFFDESSTPYISIMLGQIEDPYSTVEGQWCRPGAVIITANSGLKAPDCVQIAEVVGGNVVSGTWIDSKGSHEIPCVLLPNGVHISDLGSQLVIHCSFENSYGDSVSPLPADTIKKGVNWMASLREVVARHTQAYLDAKGRLYPPQTKQYWRYDRSSERIAKQFEHFMRGHQE